jgi:hypothetical protein
LQASIPIFHNQTVELDGSFSASFECFFYFRVIQRIMALNTIKLAARLENIIRHLPLMSVLFHIIRGSHVPKSSCPQITIDVRGQKRAPCRKGRLAEPCTLSVRGIFISGASRTEDKLKSADEGPETGLKTAKVIYYI